MEQLWNLCPGVDDALSAGNVIPRGEGGKKEVEGNWTGWCTPVILAFGEAEAEAGVS